MAGVDRDISVVVLVALGADGHASFGRSECTDTRGNSAPRIGEWQKVALARAVLRDSQILILDEPTSAMDAKAETELFERFHELARGRMMILISHRLSTVKMADRIYVIDRGQIVEQGTHDELLGQQGVYAGLFLAQAQRYQ